ncbi:MAG: DNA cytosine methyltransferase [Candidatus Omnitrophota bacterium]
MPNKKYGFYEFFAGGGMARLGLGRQWRCLFANDNSEKKAQAYRRNFPENGEMLAKDVARITLADLPGRPHLAWASFPCQDLSLAGERGGLNGRRSGTFWPFWNLMKSMSNSGRRVPIIVLENVVGAITSNSGRDFHTLFGVLNDEDYRVGPLIMDAVHFLPQSRPRLFIVAFDKNIALPNRMHNQEPCDMWHGKSLEKIRQTLPPDRRNDWLWWRLPEPPPRSIQLADLIEDRPPDAPWHTPAETQRLLDMMSEINIAKVHQAQSQGRRIIGTVYRRTRFGGDGRMEQRAEARFDQISGCLRTPAGGSSRQIILLVEGDRIQSRLLSAREAARLMGVPDAYKLPDNYNEAYHLMGDGLAVPVVSWLEKHLLRRLIQADKRLTEAA